MNNNFTTWWAVGRASRRRRWLCYAQFPAGVWLIALVVGETNSVSMAVISTIAALAIGLVVEVGSWIEFNKVQHDPSCRVETARFRKIDR